MYRNMEMVLNFDWIMVIENDENTHLVFKKKIGYMQSTKKKFDFNMTIWLYLIKKWISINFFFFGKTLLFNDKEN
jgi:hypothetical protein